MSCTCSPDEIKVLRRHLQQERAAYQRQQRLHLLLSPVDEAGATAGLELPALNAVNQDDCSAPDQLIRQIELITSSLNDRLAAELEEVMSQHHQRFFNGQPQERAAIMATIKYYPCDDGVELPHLAEKHFRPFTLAGLWVGLPSSPADPFRIGVAMHDTRRPSCLHELGIQKRFTDEVCLFYRVEQLHLAPALRSWMERHGQPHSTRKNILLVPLAELEWEFGSWPQSAVGFVSNLIRPDLYCW